MFAEPTTVNKVTLVDDRDTAIQSADDESSLLVRIPKALTRRQIDMSIERIFSKEMTFEKGRQTRSPTRSNARYSLTSPIKVDNLKTAFEVYEHILLANINGENVSNYQIAKRIGIVVTRKEETLKEQAMTVADERRTIGVSVTRKKRTAIDAISNVVEGKFG